MLVRRSLEETMSQYLVERIRHLANVEVVTGVAVSAIEGDAGQLRAVRWRDASTATETCRPIAQLFSFIGAEPNTDWLRSSAVELDSHGFVHTGNDAGVDRLPLETSRRGVFAVGDVRAGSVKRVAASVGDGAQAVAAIHQYFAQREKVKSTRSSK